jgi:lipopolysaccharide transport system ATP-binding protein
VSAIIKVSNLGKKYVIAHNQPRRRGYRRFSEDVAAAFTWPMRALRSQRNGHINGQPKREDFWALREVDFEVQQGEVVGIIARNALRIAHVKWLVRSRILSVCKKLTAF